MADGTRSGTSLGGRVTLSKSRARKRAAYRRFEEKSWRDKASDVTTSYRCICERNPDHCKATEHTGTTGSNGFTV